MKVMVDHDRCMGTGNCNLIAPNVFGQRDDGLVLLHSEGPGVEDWAAVRRAAAACPTGAILVEEDGEAAGG
jgi:ferredoxin